MNTRLSLLGGLLATQLLLIVGFVLLPSDSEDSSAFFSIDPASINALRIEGEGAQVELERSENGWVFADGTPADSAKIDGLIEKLRKTTRTWPVATSDSARERFEVTEEKHQRRLTVTTAQGADTELFFGTSPGYRRVHARRADVEAVYSIDFANHELPTARDEWLDRSLLGFEGISRVALEDGWVLQRTAEGWLVNGEAADPVAVQELVDRLQSLRVLGFADPQIEFNPTRTLSITDAGGASTLLLARDPATDDYLLESDRVAGRYTLASYVAEQLLEEADGLQAAELVAEPAPAEG